ncbi:MAG: hypothetical protein EXQ85_08030 [Alphaproteobacteria bacterium]|nr:hypothetical protein [Alphaproteobacteria bacterium]
MRRSSGRALLAQGPGARVLDIGAGSGLLSMMAIRVGAAAVSACEVDPVIAEVARTIIERNGYADRIHLTAKRSSDLIVGRDIDERVDVLISEVLSSDVLSEGVLATFEDALDRLVKPGASIIPEAVTAVGCLVGGAALERPAFVDRVSGFDLSAFNAPAVRRIPMFGRALEWTRLSADYPLVPFDLRATVHPPALSPFTVTATATGVAVGILQWMRIDLDRKTHFANSPDVDDAEGWVRNLHLFARPPPVATGQSATLQVGHDRSSLILALA